MLTQHTIVSHENSDPQKGWLCLVTSLSLLFTINKILIFYKKGVFFKKKNEASVLESFFHNFLTWHVGVFQNFQ